MEPYNYQNYSPIWITKPHEACLNCTAPYTHFPNQYPDFLQQSDTHQSVSDQFSSLTQPIMNEQSDFLSKFPVPVPFSSSSLISSNMQSTSTISPNPSPGPNDTPLYCDSLNENTCRPLERNSQDSNTSKMIRELAESSIPNLRLVADIVARREVVLPNDIPHGPWETAEEAKSQLSV